MDEMVQGLSREKIVGGDSDGQVGNNKQGDERVSAMATNTSW